MVAPRRHKTKNRWRGDLLLRVVRLIAAPRLAVLVAAVLLCLVTLPYVYFPFLPSHIADLSQKHRTFLPPSKRLGQSIQQVGDAIEGQQIPSWLPPKEASRSATAKDGDTSSKPISSSSSSSRFLIFRPPLEAAQGVGNLMNGLLAAHLLGKEFGRIVCVSKDWQAFYSAFESVIPECRDTTLSPRRTSQNTIWLLNFAKNPINECDLQQRLQGSEEPVIYFVANTYPGEWPSNYINSINTTTSMEDFYHLKEDLINILPWSEAPSTVVHLRQADNEQNDHRAGLDSATLAALGATLPSGGEIFLVTNQVDFYGYFETNFGWSHPPWTGIRHSAISTVQWTAGVKQEQHPSAPRKVDTTTTTNYRDQRLQLWADWWTIYKARTVYHTHSDFSASASRWSRHCGRTANSSSYEIGGLDEWAVLIFKQDHGSNNNTQNNDAVVLPFSEKSHALLMHCDMAPSKSNGLGYVLDLDDEIHDDLVDDWKNKGLVTT
jgi:hypothetical protein